MPSGSALRRWLGLAAAAAALPLTGSAMVLAPEVVELLPAPLRNFLVEWAAAVLVLALEATRAIVARRSGGAPGASTARARLDRLDAGAGRALDGGLALAVGLLAAGLLAAWVPHYLTWPWWRDTDTFAVLAQSWDAGIRPYRDIVGYNFPGHIYLHWLIGRAFGWGHPTIFPAVDAAALVGLGFALRAWSRRRLGAALPGLVGYLAFLGYYLGLEYNLVAQRDWHAALAAALALMALEAWPGRPGIWAAAALEAAALTIRPHAVLFLPAMAWAALGRPGPRRALAEWAAALVVCTALGFAPLAAAGVLDDLVHGLRIAAYGGPYSRNSPSVARETLADELRLPWVPALLATLIGLGGLGGGRGRSAWTWLLALLAALAYPVLSPVPHGYLRAVLILIGSVAAGLPTAWIASTPRLWRPSRVVVVLLILYEAMPQVPAFCSPRASARAVGTLLGWRGPDEAPPDAVHRWFHPRLCYYEWPDYGRALDYLRRATAPGTQIANVLRRSPFPPINGPVGRLSPFRAESGICWMWMVDLDLDADFAEALERTPDSVVVWAPEESVPHPRLAVPRLIDVIHRRYRPEAKFGPIEVWRRIPDG